MIDGERRRAPLKSPTVERADMFRFLKTLFSGSDPAKTHKISSVVSSHQKATMGTVVRRWTGRWSCGCEGSREILQPQECPNHAGCFMVYDVEDLGTQAATTTIAS